MLHKNSYYQSKFTIISINALNKTHFIEESLHVFNHFINNVYNPQRANELSAM